MKVASTHPNNHQRLFETPQSSFGGNLWLRTTHPYKTIGSLSKDKEGGALITMPPAGKRSSSTKNFKTRSFFLKESKLYYSAGLKSNDKLKAFLDLEFAYLALHTATSDKESPSGERVQFSIERGDRFTLIEVEGRQSIQTWLRELSIYCVREDFHPTYFATAKIGSGAFGKVFKLKKRNLLSHDSIASEEEEEQLVAKALPRRVISEDEEKLEGLKNEIRAMRRVRGNALFVQFWGVFETKNSVYLILEHIEGRDLIDIDNPAIYKQQERFKVMGQLFSALGHLRDLRIAHRDLKHDNILISKRGVIKVIDFGLALLDTSNINGPAFEGLLGTKAGTPGYMAPELLKANTGREMGLFGPKTDIYSVGIILYLMVTGKHPFEGNDAISILKKNRKGRVDLNPQTNSSLANVGQEELGVLKLCLEAKPD